MTPDVARRLERQIRQVQRGRDPRARRYDSELRKAVAAHALAERSRGVSVRSTAFTLNLPYQTLQVWLQSQPESFREVAKTPDPAASHGDLRVITAQGHRIEGLSRDDVVVLLRALS